jgi:L-iditol 2-dehydrogenase
VNSIVWKQARELVAVDAPKPEVRANEVLVRVALTGICGSDVHAYLGRHRFRKPPAVLGHELVGFVEEVGENVRRFKVGDYVSVNPQIACGDCVPCQGGFENLCLNKVVPGTTRWTGTFGEYFPAPEHTVIALPEGVSLNAGVLIEPLAVAVHAVRRAEQVEGRRVLVVGAGAIGFLIAVAARHFGATDITCVDIDPVALEASRVAGFATIDPRDETPQPADVVFLTAGHQGAVNQALAACKRRGTLVLVSMWEGDIPIDIYQAVFNEIDLKGSMTYVTADYADAVAIALAHPYVGDVVGAALPFDAATDAFEDIVSGRRGTIKTVFDPAQHTSPS